MKNVEAERENKFSHIFKDILWDGAWKRTHSYMAYKQLTGSFTRLERIYY
jgi:hypothetical protein